MGVGATAGVRSRDATRAKLHAVAPEKPMMWRRFIRQPSDAPVAVGVTVGGCSRDDAQAKPQRVKHRLNRCREKTRRRFNRWLRKISAELQTLLLIQIFKTKALSTQFGPFSRDNLTPQTLTLSARKLLYKHRQIKNRARFKHKNQMYEPLCL